GAEADLHLLTLEVARRPVVHDREAADRALSADDNGDLELVVELLGPGRVGDLVVRAVDRGRVREVKDRELVPLRGHLPATRYRPCVENVFLERIRVADGRRPRNRCEQADVLERVFVVFARRAAAGEEGRERLRSEVDDPVAFDHADPAPGLAIARRKDTQPHGSVWTITSAISGRSRRMRSSTSLARR